MGEFKAGKINKYILSSDILERDITLSIYLPEDFTELFKSQVIICFDGLDFSDLKDSAWIWTSKKRGTYWTCYYCWFHYEDVEKRREEFHPQGSRSQKTIQSVVKELLPSSIKRSLHIRWEILDY